MNPLDIAQKLVNNIQTIGTIAAADKIAELQQKLLEAQEERATLLSRLAACEIALESQSKQQAELDKDISRDGIYWGPDNQPLCPTCHMNGRRVRLGRNNTDAVSVGSSLWRKCGVCQCQA